MQYASAEWQFAIATQEKFPLTGLGGAFKALQHRVRGRT